MNTSKSLACGLLIASALGTLSTSAQANLIVNGGFGTGNFAGWTQFGNTHFTGVQGLFRKVDPVDSDFQAYFGAIGTPGGIEQTVATVPGETYDIKFALYDYGGPHSEYTVMFGNTVLQSVNNPTSFGYTDFDFSTVATGTDTTLSFSFRQDPSFFLLDDVAVNRFKSASVPDSTFTGALLGLAMFGLAGFRRLLA